VEHAVASWIGQRAVKEGKRFVELTCLPTEKNLPALEFITGIGHQFRNQCGTSWIFPAERLASVQHKPDENAPISQEPPQLPTRKIEAPPGMDFGIADHSARLQRIGESLCDIDIWQSD